MSTAHDKCDCCLVLYVGTLPFTVQTVRIIVYFFTEGVLFPENVLRIVQDIAQFPKL